MGVPMGGICQVAYVVQDLQQSMKDFGAKFNIGPWYYADAYTIEGAKYRGEPTSMKMNLALGFSGSMCFELIQPADTEPSVYWDIINKRGYGFHHLGMATQTFEADVERYRQMGYELVFEGSTPRGIRFAYFDTSTDMPGMLELIEINDAQDQFLLLMHQASVDWDGEDPARDIGLITSQLKSPPPQ